MNSIDNQLSITSPSNFYPFEYLNSFFSDGLPFFNTINDDGTTNTQAFSEWTQPTNISNPLACATRLPVQGTSCTLTTSSNIPPKVSIRPQENENIPPPPHSNRGRKRKPSTTEIVTPQPQKRKRRTLPAKQNGKQKAVEVDSAVPSVPSQYDDGSQNTVSGANQDVIIDNLAAIHTHRALEDVAQSKKSRAIQLSGTVKDIQQLNSIVHIFGLPGIISVNPNKSYPTRILHMMLTVSDPALSSHILGAFFVPYLWFKEDPQHPQRIGTRDKYLWGDRIQEYHCRVKCGRIGLTITGSPVLFFKQEETKLIDSINYKIVVESHLRKGGQIQAMPGISGVDEISRPMPVAAPSDLAQAGAPPIEEQQPPNFQNDDSEWTFEPDEEIILQQLRLNDFGGSQLGYNDNGSEQTSQLDDAAIAHQFGLLSVVTNFADSQLNYNANGSEQTFELNEASAVHQLGLPPLLANCFTDSQLNNYNDSSCQTSELTEVSVVQQLGPPSFVANDFADSQLDNYNFNIIINDLPIIGDTPSHDIFQSTLTELVGDSTHNHSLDMFQSSTSNCDPLLLSGSSFEYNLPFTDPFTKTPQSFSQFYDLDITPDSGSSNEDTIASIKELEDMYTNSNQYE